ncbi:acetyl-CoA carboxylase biotin carboxyl carrier protein [Fusobacterium varium]|jgi:acetyl-CoA carboxylase biotin carboxyl carrier protein|uniref:Biotin carboxyl carrier protein of acetyl-CoA carboxylase n=1 Tax=Fusobacterium varium ATCC 27725 TaxID=469618 RepID=A0ABM6U7V4_FUSVA|nr:acetyl-CoA carboxylase biotin carboxyl carrier protein [Fusobacterium varium]MCD7979640.1 acetyl-CoA carboxylase biotin carboxyl carrier protein [Fusobacterium sp.]AVQ32508.1 acetyl-CoA carboxylase biotin carboxyl carrier protein [Fusobacterium varium ATCC 27725]EES64450.2 acetyl-CoA carboxylase, biotin carboxyl carrier protein [Fusobacterium varium ATCC 27725]MCF0169917.1 acetyl-CoA carboxylase biotin carboxyl carrier protein [Fusobacterium varium]RHG34931.1 acetyl-CoA carboxylase biotin c
MKIDLKTIKDLAENIDKYNLNEVVIESEGAKVTLKKEIPVPVETVVTAPRGVIVQNVEEVTVEKTVEATAEPEEMETINSPMVGTFYKSSAPGNPAFVTEGQTVSAGDTLCIIEAMKLMNEVKSHKNCTIVKVLVEDGQLVKKGDKLFSVK